MSGEGQGAPQEAKLLSEPHQLAGVSNQQAQYLQAIDQQRRARQEIPRIYSEHAPPPILQTASPGRQANPDIQDIITGIVKLLNGNVNVAANTVRPLRPIQATRCDDFRIFIQYCVCIVLSSFTNSFDRIFLGSTTGVHRGSPTFHLCHPISTLLG